MIYKVGDKVRVDPNLQLTTRGLGVNSEMVQLAGQLVTISKKVEENIFDDDDDDDPQIYYSVEENPRWWWIDAFFIEEVSNEIKESYDKLFERSDTNV